MSNMLFESEIFESKLNKPVNLSNHVFRYCDFIHIHSDGSNISSVFINCSFEQCEWYWANFNHAILVQVKFKNCKFFGAVFAASRFVECEFIDCEFAADNLDGECSFDNVAWYKCRQENCKGIEKEFLNKK